MCTGYTGNVTESVSEGGSAGRVGVELDPVQVDEYFMVLCAPYLVPFTVG